MQDSDVERDLREVSVRPVSELPSNFSSQVLKKARAVKDAAQAHWRLLAAATIIAAVGAFFISGWMARQSQNTPPSIPVFDSNSTLFSTADS